MRNRQGIRRAAAFCACLGACALLLTGIPISAAKAEAEDITGACGLTLSARAEQQRLLTDRRVTTS